MQSNSTLHEMLKFSLAYRTKSVILHEKRKSPLILHGGDLANFIVIRHAGRLRVEYDDSAMCRIAMDQWQVFPLNSHNLTFFFLAPKSLLNHPCRFEHSLSLCQWKSLTSFVMPASYCARMTSIQETPRLVTSCGSQP